MSAGIRQSPTPPKSRDKRTPDADERRDTEHKRKRAAVLVTHFRTVTRAVAIDYCTGMIAATYQNNTCELLFPLGLGGPVPHFAEFV